MADNVNIIVQDTINDIVVNAAVVVETIDINVQAAVDVVDIVANPNNYVVNINRIIGEQVQSDWTQNDNQAPDYIKNKPTIPAAQVNSDWDATSGVAEILNKPTIPTKTSDLTNDGENGVDPFITAADIPPVTGFVPYTGATEDVNLGEFGLLTGNIEFDNTPTNVPTSAGAMYWNDADGTADLILKGGNVKLQVGQESVLRVVNKTATNINLLEANYQAVRVTGAQGQRLKVDLAQATTDNLSAETIGLVTETINNNQEGFITTSGLVRSINTTGSLQGETWADGDILYLSPTTAGRVTKVKPVAPNHLVIIGYVVHAHANNGSIFVKVDNGYELDELHNCKITTPANNNVLAYTSATDIWENKTVETALGYTPFQLPALTSGSVLFSNGSTIAQKNASFFWDNTNNRLGIGTATPSEELTVVGTIRSNAKTGADNVFLEGYNSAGTLVALMKEASTGGFGGLMFNGQRMDATNGAGVFFNGFTGTTASGNSAAIQFVGSGGTISSVADLPIGIPIALFSKRSGGVTVNQMALLQSGNLLIQNGGTFTDAGYRLDVNGTARVSGTTTTQTILPATNQTYNIGSGTAQFSTIYSNIHQSNGTGIVRSGASSNLLMQVNGGTEVARFTTGLNVLIGTTTDAGFRLDVNGTARVSGTTTITPAALTGTAATSALDIAQTWNTTGTPIALKVNITDTASASLSDLMSLQVGGSVRFRVLKSGYFSHNTGGEIQGSLVVGSASINASAVLQSDSVTKGFLPPRMTTTQKNAIATPAAGLVVYDTTLGKLCVRGASAWETITSI